MSFARSTFSRFTYLLMLTMITVNAQEAETYANHDGWWLRNVRAEAFVCAMPYPRVLAFRLRGGHSPLFVTDDFDLIGMRSRIHQPESDTDHSQSPALQPAEATWLGERSIQLLAAPDIDKSGLRLTMEVTLHDTLPLLRLRHGFRNLREEPQLLAAWAILAVPDSGIGILPYNHQSFARRLIHFPGLSIVQPCVDYGKHALTVDYAVPPEQNWFKIGTDSTAGWVAYVKDNLVIRSMVDVPRDATFPESGATVTIFKWRGGNDWQQQPFGEIEHNGPLRTVASGESIVMDQIVELRDDLLPDASGPDGWHKILTATPIAAWAD